MVEHQRPEVIHLAHIAAGFIFIHAFTLAAFPQSVAITNAVLLLIVIHRVDDRNI